MTEFEQSNVAISSWWHKAQWEAYLLLKEAHFSLTAKELIARSDKLGDRFTPGELSSMLRKKPPQANEVPFVVKTGKDRDGTIEFGPAQWLLVADVYDPWRGEYITSEDA